MSTDTQLTQSLDQPRAGIESPEARATRIST